MYKRITNASSPDICEQEGLRLIYDILNSCKVSSFKANTEAFLRHIESMDDMHKWMIRNRFYNIVMERDINYQHRTPGLQHNAVIIPPELALAAMVPAFVMFTGSHYDFVNGLRYLISHCDKFIDSIYPAISEEEIRVVLNAAQRVFGMIGIIAPDYPLRIYRFDCSHERYNSECAVLNGGSRQSIIFLYHPCQNEIYDRVFIFAHELGHALHFALTGDIDDIPLGFDNFNKRLGVELDNTESKQESFADAVAIAILSSPYSRLRSHLPSQFCKDISPVFIRYLKNVCNVI